MVCLSLNSKYRTRLFFGCSISIFYIYLNLKHSQMTRCTACWDWLNCSSKVEKQQRELPAQKNRKGWDVYLRVNVFTESESNFSEAGGVRWALSGWEIKNRKKSKWDTLGFAIEQTRREVITHRSEHLWKVCFLSSGKSIVSPLRETRLYTQR